MEDLTILQPIIAFLQRVIPQPVVDFLQVGGPVVWILMVFSVVASSIVLLKLWQFMVTRAESLKASESAIKEWRDGNLESALGKLNKKRPIDSVVAYTMESLIATNTNVELVREEAERRAMNQLSGLRSFLRPLEIIATLSPLLGLLGTVLGMITAFQQMEGAGSQVDPSVLSGGIWQALLTTAVGLAVAIPVVTLHSWLERKVERIAHNMNDAVTQVFTSQEKVSSIEEALEVEESPEVQDSSEVQNSSEIADISEIEEVADAEGSPEIEEKGESKEVGQEKVDAA